MNNANLDQKSSNKNGKYKSQGASPEKEHLGSGSDDEGRNIVEGQKKQLVVVDQMTEYAMAREGIELKDIQPTYYKL